MNDPSAALSIATRRAPSGSMNTSVAAIGWRPKETRPATRVRGIARDKGRDVRVRSTGRLSHVVPRWSATSIVYGPMGRPGRLHSPLLLASVTATTTGAGPVVDSVSLHGRPHGSSRGCSVARSAASPRTIGAGITVSVASPTVRNATARAVGHTARNVCMPRGTGDNRNEPSPATGAWTTGLGLSDSEPAPRPGPPLR